MMETMTETMKDWGKQVKEFLDENRELIFMIAGAIAAVASVCAVLGLLCRKKLPEQKDRDCKNAVPVFCGRDRVGGSCGGERYVL